MTKLCQMGLEIIIVSSDFKKVTLKKMTVLLTQNAACLGLGGTNIHGKPDNKQRKHVFDNRMEQIFKFIQNS